MILNFDGFIINEASLKKLKREVHGSLNMSARKRMRKELRNNIITFKFRKRNGDLRTAHGTLHPDYLPKLKGGSPRPEHQMVYYDLDKEGWRSFRSYSFIKILNIKPVDGPPKHKPVEKEEEEEVKKVVPTKEKEKEMEKDTHTEEKEEKKKVREIDDEIEDDDDKKSVLDDKDTPEEEEVIKKDKEKEKEENEEKEPEKEDEEDEKDKDKKSEDE